MKFIVYLSNHTFEMEFNFIFCFNKTQIKKEKKMAKSNDRTMPKPPVCDANNGITATVLKLSDDDSWNRQTPVYECVALDSKRSLFAVCRIVCVRVRTNRSGSVCWPRAAVVRLDVSLNVFFQFLRMFVLTFLSKPLRLAFWMRLKKAFATQHRLLNENEYTHQRHHALVHTHTHWRSSTFFPFARKN